MILLSMYIIFACLFCSMMEHIEICVVSEYQIF